MVDPNLPITNVAIFADKSKAPSDYTIVDKSSDAYDDADLWKDGFLRRTYRYIGFTKDSRSSDVLVGLQIINEKEDIPAGFYPIENTFDTNEKALKKKIVCVKMMSKNTAKSAITDIIINRSRRLPAQYTLICDLNNLLICYKSSYLQTETQANRKPVNEVVAPEYNRASSTLGRMTVTPMSGVQFRLAKKFQSKPGNDGKNNFMTGSYSATDNLKSPEQIEREYKYDYSVEDSVLRN